MPLFLALAAWLAAVVCARTVCNGETNGVPFAASSPRESRSLSFCKEFKGNTCCNKSHTDAIQRAIYPFFVEDFDDACRQV